MLKGGTQERRKENIANSKSKSKEHTRMAIHTKTHAQ